MEEAKEIILAALPTNVRNQVDIGEDVTISLKVNNISGTVPDSDGSVIEQTLTASDTIEIVLSIDLQVSAGTESDKITELDSPIQIKIPMPNKGPKCTYKVISVHNSVAIEYNDISPSGSDYILIEVDETAENFV